MFDSISTAKEVIGWYSINSLIEYDTIIEIKEPDELVILPSTLRPDWVLRSKVGELHEEIPNFRPQFRQVATELAAMSAKRIAEDSGSGQFLVVLMAWREVGDVFVESRAWRLASNN